MTVTDQRGAAGNLAGSLWMIASMAGFAAEDAFLKAAVTAMPLGQVLILLGLAGMLVFALIARQRGEAAFPRVLASRGLMLRSGFEVTGRLFYALALALTPLSTASAILQATPLVVVLGAAVLFGERVGVLRWCLILLGFAGVLVILRPGTGGFDMLSLLAVVGMLGFAGRDLATRAAPPALSNAQLGVLGFLMLAVSGGLILAVTGGAVLPPPAALLPLAGASVFGIAGYAALTEAMRTGEVSTVTPFRYTRLVFALILGAVVFGERPDALTLIGAAVIVGAGIWTLSTAPRRA
jgi:drug/metabolite transporter (DMT)-like permease